MERWAQRHNHNTYNQCDIGLGLKKCVVTALNQIKTKTTQSRHTCNLFLKNQCSYNLKVDTNDLASLETLAYTLIVVVDLMVVIFLF